MFGGDRLTRRTRDRPAIDLDFAITEGVADLPGSTVKGLSDFQVHLIIALAYLDGYPSRFAAARPHANTLGLRAFGYRLPIHPDRRPAATS